MHVFWAASCPDMSKVGSGSAKPSFCAKERAVSKDNPSSAILEKIKLDVPFKIPAKELI